MAMKRVLGYLKYTQDYALYYNKYLMVLEGYSDENWITGFNELKSTSGYVFTIGGGAVSWKSSKQTCIAHSTMESEFITLDKVGEEVEWLRHFLDDIPYWPKPVATVCIHCDSQAAIGRAGSVMYNGKSRHIRRRHNTVRELISSGIIIVDYVKSKDNMPDPLTKDLSREGVERTSKGMGLRPWTNDNKATERRTKRNYTINGAHIVEDDQNHSQKRRKVEQGSNQPKKKFKGKCFNYGKIGHKSMDCRAPKKSKKKNQANMVESNKEYDDLCAMFSECNLVGNPCE
ncbi:hypothetical protein BC332_26164 [Capsicum chinense]|nr:hypothetical protein BC332_26164 [Capsicum chinense]